MSGNNNIGKWAIPFIVAAGFIGTWYVKAADVDRLKEESKDNVKLAFTNKERIQALEIKQQYIKEKVDKIDMKQDVLLNEVRKLGDE